MIIFVPRSIMKDQLLYINNANDLAVDVGAPVWHPMVSVVHFDELGQIRYSLNKLGVYAIFEIGRAHV